MPSWPELPPDEFELSELSELLWRQIHPGHVDGGKVSSLAFRPSAKDDGQLSTSRSQKVSAAQAYEYHTVTLGLAAAGTYAVSVGDVAEEDLRAVDDSATGNEATPPGHAYIDFRQVPSDKRCRKIAARLRDKAEGRSWQ